MEPLELLGDGEILQAEPDGEQHVGVSEFHPALLKTLCQNYFGLGKLALELLCSGRRKTGEAAESGGAGERNTDFGHRFPPKERWRKIGSCLGLVRTMAGRACPTRLSVHRGSPVG